MELAGVFGAPPLGLPMAAALCLAIGATGVVAAVAGAVLLMAAVLAALAGIALLLLRAMWFPARDPLLAPLK